MLAFTLLWLIIVLGIPNKGGNDLKKILLIGLCLLLISGCSRSKHVEGKINIVATTTMLTDLVSQIGKDHVSLTGLMGPGIDPHLYQASAGNVIDMQNADIVVYNGVHLEGKMSEIFDELSKVNKTTIKLEDGLNQSALIHVDEETLDPHIWFDVKNWEDGARYVAQQLSAYDPENAADYAQNAQDYLKQLEELDTYVRTRAEELPSSQRYLVTAHDAFNYFARAYGFEVVAIQGISTSSEASTTNIRHLADLIVEKKIKAIFVESSVPTKTIQSLKDAVSSRGFNVEIGGSLYSDSLGDKQSNTETYIKTVKANIDTIVDALK